jgi:hypothetical protein
VSSLALALSRASFPVLRFLPLVGPILRTVRSGAPVQGFHPSAKRYLLVAGRCLRAVGSAPLTGFRQLPRDSASTSRPCSSRRSLVVPRFDPASDSLPLFRFLGVSGSPLPVCRPPRGSFEAVRRLALASWAPSRFDLIFDLSTVPYDRPTEAYNTEVTTHTGLLRLASLRT